jgi:hypothetical protein
MVSSWGGPQSQPGQYGELKILVLTRTRTPNPLSSNPYAVTLPTEMYVYMLVADEVWT